MPFKNKHFRAKLLEILGSNLSTLAIRHTLTIQIPNIIGIQSPTKLGCCYCHPALYLINKTCQDQIHDWRKLFLDILTPVFIKCLFSWKMIYLKINVLYYSWPVRWKRTSLARSWARWRRVCCRPAWPFPFRLIIQSLTNSSRQTGKQAELWDTTNIIFYLSFEFRSYYRTFD